MLVNRQSFAIIMGAENGGLLRMLVNKPSLTTIMKRMPAVDWKQGATDSSK
jgi:hypothetical protein